MREEPLRKAAFMAHEAAVRRLAAVLDRRTADLARRADAGDVRAGLPALAFSAGQGLYGLAVSDVAEVLPGRVLSPSPGAAPVVLGLFAHAGRVLAAIDTLRLVGAGTTDPAASAGGMLVVLRARERRLALQVDRALGVVAVDPPVAVEGGGLATWVGVHPAPGSSEAVANTLALLDAARLIAALHPSPLALSAPGA